MRLFILFMIVLLPLRGLAGDLMAVQTAAAGFATQAASAMPADCPMKSMRASASADDESTAPSGIEGCSSCDLCLPMVELERRCADAIAFGPHAAPPIDGVDFFSVLPTLAFKPPIF